MTNIYIGDFNFFSFLKVTIYLLFKSDANIYLINEEQKNKKNIFLKKLLENFFFSQFYLYK